MAAECATKAFALKEQVSEYEKLRISDFYYGYARGELHKVLEVQALLLQIYPGKASVAHNHANVYNLIGQSERAVPVLREAIRLNPKEFYL